MFYQKSRWHIGIGDQKVLRKRKVFAGKSKNLHWKALCCLKGFWVSAKFLPIPKVLALSRYLWLASFAILAMFLILPFLWMEMFDISDWKASFESIKVIAKNTYHEQESWCHCCYCWKNDYNIKNETRASSKMFVWHPVKKFNYYTIIMYLDSIS